MLHGNEACQACAYWQRLKGEDAKLGLCRVRGPTTERRPESLMCAAIERASWPMTGEEDWCGEFVGTPPNNSTRLKEALDEIPPLEPQTIREGEIQPQRKPPATPPEPLRPPPSLRRVRSMPGLGFA